MNKPMATVMTVAATSVAVGAAAYMLNSKNMKSTTRKVKKSASHALKTAGAFMSDMGSWLK